MHQLGCLGWGRGSSRTRPAFVPQGSNPPPTPVPAWSPHLCPLNTFPCSCSGWKLFSLCLGCRYRRAGEQGPGNALALNPSPDPAAPRHSPRYRDRPGKWSHHCHHRTCNAQPGPWSRPGCPRQRVRTAAAHLRRPPTAGGGWQCESQGPVGRLGPTEPPTSTVATGISGAQGPLSTIYFSDCQPPGPQQFSPESPNQGQRPEDALESPKAWSGATRSSGQVGISKQTQA